MTKDDTAKAIDGVVDLMADKFQLPDDITKDYAPEADKNQLVNAVVTDIDDSSIDQISNALKKCIQKEQERLSFKENVQSLDDNHEKTIEDIIEDRKFYDEHSNEFLIKNI